MPDYSKAAKIIVTLAPVLIEAGRQYLESKSRTQQDTGVANGAAAAVDNPGPPVPPGPTRRPTDKMIDDIRPR